MKIAIPLLSIATPVGVVWGLVEAYRFHPMLAGLMFLLLAVISGFVWMTVRTVRRERLQSEDRSKPPPRTQ